MVKIKCLHAGIIVFQGKSKEYIFQNAETKEVEDEDVPIMLSLELVSGGCCGAPKVSTPYFKLIE